MLSKIRSSAGKDQVSMARFGVDESGRIKPLVSRSTYGFRELTRSTAEAALHGAPTLVSYCRDGHYEPPGTQPARPSSGN
jgi:hypothetical protein